MNQFKRALVKAPILGRLVLISYRAKTGISYFRIPLANLARWLVTSREITNFTYDLDEINRRYLASLISDVTSEAFDVIMGYIMEIESDEELKAHILDSTGKSEFAFEADSAVRFGRRIGWYALARALKPRTIVETGVDKGLGSCVLAAALKRNQKDGYEGRYYGTDINPKAGYLLTGVYAEYGRILYGDSIESLKTIDGPVDLFINDSDHSADYESAEYRTIESKLSERALILGDNCHCTSRLLEFSREAGRHFVFFQERPRMHWYPGGGIGISFMRFTRH